MAIAAERFQYGYTDPILSPLKTELPQRSSYQIEGQNIPEQSIYESYDPLVEAGYLQKNEQLTPAQRNYYIHESIQSYVEEFVAKVPYKELSGILKDDGTFEVMGMDVGQMYESAAARAGYGSREHEEKIGYQAVRAQIDQGNNRVLWVSPPKIADYGFVFTFTVGEHDPELGGRPLKETLLRYDEDMHTLETSKDKYDYFSQEFGDSSSMQSATSYKPFLERPIGYQYDGHDDMDAVRRYLGISPEDIQKSQYVKDVIMPKVQPFVTKYQTLMSELLDLDLTYPSARRSELEAEMKLYIGAIHNSAKLMMGEANSPQNREQLEDMQLLRLTQSRANYDGEWLYMAAAQMAARESLVIRGGSNCPVTGLGAASMLSNFVGMGGSMESGLQLLGLPEKQFDYKEDPNLCRCKRGSGPHFHCPGKKEGKSCKHPIVVGKGIKSCPQCGEGKRC
ncbi:MAG: hypothetical protein ACEQSA_00605 [Weeksellaceae bacterium]